MRIVVGLAVAAAVGFAWPVPAAAGHENYRMEAGINQAAQLAEMLHLYEDLCLTAFPKDGTIFQKVVALKGTKPVTGTALDEIFHGDPGLAWIYQGKNGRFTIAVEAPPFHACTIRATAAGFGETRNYRAVAERYEKNAGGFHDIDLVDRVNGDIRTVLAGERKDKPDGSTDALLILVTTPASDALRQAGYTGVDVRLVHQIAQPERSLAKK
jgi:hypothetical protein